MRLLCVVLSIMFLFSCVSANETHVNEERIENYIKNSTEHELFGFYVSKETPGSFDLMWSDPGYVKGPCVEDSNSFYVIAYSTTTYNEDGTIRFTDEWKYYYPISGEKYCYRYNRYSGKGYHGGSLVHLYGDTTFAKEDLQKVISREWSDKELGLYNILFKGNE